jgi:hypothetical protein
VLEVQVKAPLPKVPGNLDPLAREILEGLQGKEEARAIVIGGGVALQHYLEFRGTVDLDAWWSGKILPQAQALIREVMKAVAERNGLSFAERPLSHSLTQSFELRKAGRKVFSFQIAPRDLELDPALPSAWSPVQIETFRDNLGAKMNALVSRGAPRDFLDIYTVCQRGLAAPAECWGIWKLKNPGLEVSQARVTVLEHLAALEGRRPLAGISPETDRKAARELRDWVRNSLCKNVAP